MRTVPRCWENRLNYPVLLNEILAWCLREHKVDTLLLTSRAFEKGRAYPAVESVVKSLFREYRVKKLEATGWPGTELISRADKVYVARFDKVVMDRMIEMENELFNWVHWPNRLPEDICVFRSGDRFPVLVSVTHEKDAWVISDKKGSPPGFKKSNIQPEELFIWDGPFFCRV